MVALWPEEDESRSRPRVLGYTIRRTLSALLALLVVISLLFAALQVSGAWYPPWWGK